MLLFGNFNRSTESNQATAVGKVDQAIENGSIVNVNYGFAFEVAGKSAGHRLVILLHLLDGIVTKSVDALPFARQIETFVIVRLTCSLPLTQ